MKVKELIKELSMKDPEAFVVYGNSDGCVLSITEAVEDEGINDLDSWDVLSGWRDLKEMQDYYGATDSDPLAFMSVVVLR